MERKAATPNNMPAVKATSNGVTSNAGSPMEGAPEAGMKRKITLWGGVALIVGTIVGSGIFISPEGVFRYTQSVGLSLVIWALSGLFSCLGALCYAELGALVGRNGGEYTNLLDSMGPLAGFLQLWASLVVLQPVPLAVMALTMATYVAKPLAKDCDVPTASVKLFAVMGLMLLTAVNVLSVRFAMRVQGVFTWAKVLALMSFIVAGGVSAATDGLDNFDNMWDGKLSPTGLAMASYFGLFSFGGWNQLNFVISELQDPYRNLPRAICIAVPLVTVVYVLVNAAYFIVLSKDEMLSSSAIAMTFGNKMMPLVPWMVPLFVALSCFGSINGILFTSSRLFEAGATHGHLPSLLANRHLERHTPVPALLITCILSAVMVLLADVYALIQYMNQVLWLFVALSVVGLLRLRHTRPDCHRPIKVPLAVPIIFLIVCSSILIVGAWAEPVNTGLGMAITLTGIPVYFIGTRCGKPDWMRSAGAWVTRRLQAMLMVAEQDAVAHM